MNWCFKSLVTNRVPRVPVAASSERGSVSRSTSARPIRFQSAAGHKPALRCFGACRSECPNGASSFSPGLARQRRDYPGLNEQNSHNPEGVVSFRAQPNAATTPLGLLNPFDPLTQGSFATLGWRTESRWDSFWTAPRPAAPEGQNTNSRGCQPTVNRKNTTRPRRGRTIHRTTICSTLSGSGKISGTCSVGWHPRLFTLNPVGIFGLRRQSVAATALSHARRSHEFTKTIARSKSGVAPTRAGLPPQSKTRSARHVLTL